MSDAVAAVIPAYNGEAFIGSAVRSALCQTRPPAEVVVVDDGSTDGTQRVVHHLQGSHPRLRLVRQANGGVSAARNRGIEETSSPLIAFLDCDDLWYPAKLERQISFLNAEPDRVMVGTRMDYLDETGAPMPGATGEQVRSARMTDIRAGRFLPFPLSSAVVRRDHLQAVGCFDVSLRDIGQVEDVDVMARLARRGSLATLPGRAQGGYRLHAASASATAFFAAREGVRFVRARLEAEDQGSTLTIEEFRGDRGPHRTNREDRAMFHFRESGVALAQHRTWHAAGQLCRGLVQDPGYVTRRLWLRAAAARAR